MRRQQRQSTVDILDGACHLAHAPFTDAITAQFRAWTQQTKHYQCLEYLVEVILDFCSCNDTLAHLRQNPSALYNGSRSRSPQS